MNLVRCEKYDTHSISNGKQKLTFQGWALPLYFSLDIAVILFPFIFRSWRDAIAPVGTLLVQTAVAAIFFVLVPIEPGYQRNNWSIWGPYFYEYFGLDNFIKVESCTFVTCCIRVYTRKCHWNAIRTALQCSPGLLLYPFPPCLSMNTI